MLVKQKKLFSNDECESIIKLIKLHSQNWNFSDRKYISESISYNDETRWLFDRLSDFFNDYVESKLQKLKKNIHFHIFETGCWFDKHNDVRDGRLFAVGVLLNDNFEGGDFKIYTPDEIIIDKIVGNSYIFNVELFHEVTKITSGVRYSLIWFLQNDHIKNKTNKLL